MIENILAKALTIIRPSNVSVRHFVGNQTNSVGYVKKTYTKWIGVLGIVEPGIVSAFGGKNISEKDYEFMGLDWSRYYVTCWLNMADVKNVHLRGGSDQIKYNGKTFTILQIANWHEYDKWQRCYCVETDDEDEAEIEPDEETSPETNGDGSGSVEGGEGSQSGDENNSDGDDSENTEEGSDNP